MVIKPDLYRLKLSEYPVPRADISASSCVIDNVGKTGRGTIETLTISVEVTFGLLDVTESKLQIDAIAKAFHEELEARLNDRMLRLVAP